MEYKYDPRAGFRFVHDIYIELAKFGYSLQELYEYSIKELLFILKYRREGLAYEIWRNGTMMRASQAKKFPIKAEEAIPELFEKADGVAISSLPPELQEMFKNGIQENINQHFGPNI